MPVANDKSLLWSGLAGGVILLLVWSISAPPLSILFSDFFQAYYSTGEHLLHVAGPAPTWPLQQTCTEGFVNVPILAWLFVPFALMGKPAAAWTFFGLGIAAVSAAWILLRRLCRPEAQCSALLLFLFLVNGPMIHSFREGNTTHFVLLLLIVTLLLWRAGAEYAAGLVLGLCAALKLPLLLYGAYFVLRRRWWIVAGGATMIGLIVALSIAVFGSRLNVGWYNYCVGPFIGRIMPGFNAQSIDTFLYRLVDGPAHLHVWYLIDPSPAHRFVRTIIFAALFGGAFLFIWRAQRREPMPAVTGILSARDLLEFVLVLNLALVASPVSWAHYYLLLLLPWGLYLGGRLLLSDDAATKWLMGGGIVLASLPVVMLPQDLGPLAGLASRTVVSACFLGGMLTLVALARGAWQMTRLPGTVSETGAVIAASQPTADNANWAESLTRLLKGEHGGLSHAAVLTRNLAIFFILNAFVLNAILWFASPTGFNDTVLGHTWDFLIGHSDDDSWGPMTHALDYFEREYMPPISSTPLYTEMVFNEEEKFQYPPSSLFVIAGIRAADALFGTPFVKDALSWLSVIVTAMATAALLEYRLKQSNPIFYHDKTAWLRPAIVIGISLTFYPVVKAFSLGQIQVWINAIFALALLCWATERRALAGLSIGLIALIKPHYGLMFLWALLRRRWSFFIVGTLTIGFGLAMSLYVFDWANHVDYLRFLSYIAERGESYYPNQSINGLLNRLMSIADPVQYNNLIWRDGKFPPFNQWVYGATLVSSILLLAIALVRRRRDDDIDGTLDFCTIAVGCTLASPIAWEHHFGILLPVYAVLLAHFLHDRRRLIWLAVSFMLASNYFPVTKLVANTPFNVAQSYLLVATLIVFALLVWRPSVAQERALSAPARNSGGSGGLSVE